MEEAWGYLQQGQGNRMSAATTMNACSSRSHCLVCLRVHGRSRINGRNGLPHLPYFALQAIVCFIAGKKPFLADTREALQKQETSVRCCKRF